MTEFEDQLRRALERKEPTADFTARVMARAMRAKRPVWLGWQASFVVAAILCALGAVTWLAVRPDRALANVSSHVQRSP